MTTVCVSVHVIPLISVVLLMVLVSHGDRLMHETVASSGMHCIRIWQGPNHREGDLWTTEHCIYTYINLKINHRVSVSVSLITHDTSTIVTLRTTWYRLSSQISFTAISQPNRVHFSHERIHLLPQSLQPRRNVERFYRGKSTRKWTLPLTSI